MKKIKERIDGTTILHLNGEDIELIVRLLHQELDAVQTIIKNTTNSGTKLMWLNKADHLQELIIILLR